MAEPSSKPPQLQFGWQLDVAGDPPPKVPVMLNANGLKAHTAIIAQSGSGKSFALGRLLEEVASRTDARIVILDPNSDFVRFGEIDKSAWKKKHLIPWFGPEDTPAKFEKRWDPVGVRVLTLREPKQLPPKIRAKSYPISILWGDLSLFEMVSYLGFNTRTDTGEVFMVSQARRVARHNHDKSGIQTPFTLELFEKSVTRLREALRGNTGGSLELPPEIALSDLTLEVGLAVALRCFELRTYHVWDEEAETSLHDHLDQIIAPESDDRVIEVDLPSLPNAKSQLVVTQAILDSILSLARERWAEALKAKPEDDSRTPTFIVLDEAHNLAPSEATSPQAKAVTDLLITIAAEGRKYGLFLILVTQRPSRLHESVLSQCDNLCLLRMNNRHDLQLVEKSFGFVPEGWVERALKFGVGDCLLAGNLVNQPVYAHVAPRRTVEGGRNLQDAHWTKDPLDEGIDASS